SRADERVIELRGARDVQPRAVEKRALAAHGEEDLLAQWIDGAARHHLAAALDPYRAGEDGNSVRVVGGAVERIDDEARLARAALAALFGEDFYARRALGEDAQHRFFRGLVGVGDQIDAALVRDVAWARVEIAQHLCAR